MNVRDLMKSPQACGPADSLDHAARILWERDCGVVPVVDDKRRVIGMITDSDICMAAWTKGRTLGAVPVHSAMARAVARCQPTHDVEAALRIMAEAQVHRLPVVDDNDRLLGILSLTDVLRAAQDKPTALRQRIALLVHDALARINRPRDAANKVAPKPAAKATRKPAHKPAGKRPAQSAVKSASR
jgi:CBS domain-containing protein